mgnify:CR=1 FL=1
MSLFSDQSFIYAGMLLIPVLCLIFYLSEKRKLKKLKLITSAQITSRLVSNNSIRQKILKFFIFISGISFLLIGLARPQWGTEKKVSSDYSMDILIAVDVSKSMLADDISPSRLDKVKSSIATRLPEIAGNRLGLYCFSGSTLLICPLTSDHQSFEKQLEQLQVGIIEEPGTNLVEVIQRADYYLTNNGSKNRFIILITDGEEYYKEILNEAKKVAKNGTKIFTIGAGRKEATRIPDKNDPTGFGRDTNGEIVLTKLNEKTLEQVASATDAQYFRLGGNGEGILEVFKTIKRIGKTNKLEQITTDLPIDRYQMFVLIGFFLLCFEIITTKIKQKLSNNLLLFLVIFLLTPGCFKQDNVKRAEEAIASGKPNLAGDFFKAEINATLSSGKPVDPRLFLNAGLAYLKGKELDKAENQLEDALSSLNEPTLQAKALNALGNINYQKANDFLDLRNVNEARKKWKKSREYYESSLQIDNNDKARQNLSSLNKQIEERISLLICVIKGKVWRDLNGDQKPQPIEPNLDAKIFWDIDENGEHNESTEPNITTNKEGEFAFEWISDSFPVSIRIGCNLSENNNSGKDLLLPLFPPPPPPESIESVKNYYLNLPEAGVYTIAIPHRAAPVLQGFVWKDENGNGKKDEGDKGYSSAKLYLDENGNFQHDENETSFEPERDGTFYKHVSPGQYSVCIEPKNPDANVTFPIEIKKAYLAWTDYDSVSENLDFGIQDNSKQDQNSSQSQSEDKPSENDQTDSNKENNENESASSVDTSAQFKRQRQETKNNVKPFSKIKAPKNTRYYGEY